MAFANGLTRAGFTPTRIHTTASVHLDSVEGGFAITRIDLNTEATVPGIDEAAFREQAETAKANCPVSKVLAGAEIRLNVKLVET
jgi:lipoyl-dependent peroxiredoxin